ncbi:hypothetical protein [Streptomyces sp. C1-2]|uniref:hypothetical protein n=1 Tax=Streptomyces sp. C1-2 TaxID=2720022 RepID=UPI0019D29298|nr:hypothetical protein [Streptomyces sp. C1-2]
MTEPIEQRPAAPTTGQWLRAAAHRISRGSSRLAWLLARRISRRGVAYGRRVWRGATAWLAAASGLNWLLRAAILAAGVLLARHAVPHLGHTLARHAGRASGLMGPAALAWLVAAYRVGRDGWEPPADQTEQPVETAAVAGEQPQPASRSAVSPAELVATVRDIGTPHAQLKPIAEHLRTSTDAVRAAAAGMGWPVKDVRQTGRSASAGLSWDDCPSPALATPSPGVVGAGQRADDDNDDTSGEGPGKGVRVVRTDGGLIVYDLADTYRRRGVVGH